MDKIDYRHVLNFMRAREQGVPGVPFLSLIQLGVGIGTAVVSYSMGFHFIIMIFFTIVALISTMTFQGEYVYRRLIQIVYAIARGWLAQNKVEVATWGSDVEDQFEEYERTTIAMPGSVLAAKKE